MKEIRCEMCGSTDIVKQDGCFVCQSCGIKYSVEEAKKLMIEVSGKVDVSGSTVKIDQSQRLENLKNAARMSIKNKNYETAAVQWGEIQALAPNDWEACYFASHSRSLIQRIGHFGVNDEDYRAIKGTLKQALSLLKQNESNNSKRKEAIRTLKSAVDDFINVGIAEGNRLDKIEKEYNPDGYVDRGYWRHQIIEAGKVRCSFAESISSVFSDDIDIQETAIPICQNGYNNLKQSNGLSSWELSNYEDKCKRLKDKIETTKQRKRDAEIKAKSDAFWATHQTEKKQLLDEKRALQDKIRELQNSVNLQIKNLEKKKDVIPEKVDLANVQESIGALTKERGALSLFSVSKRKELTEKIDALNAKKADIEQAIISKEKSIDQDIQRVRNNSEITVSQARINSIDDKIKHGRL